MASPRHKLVAQTASPRRFSRLAIPVAVATAVTGTVVGAAVAWPEPGTRQAAAISAPLRATVHPSTAAADREKPASRSARRVKLTPKPEKKVIAFKPGPVADFQYMTAPLNVRTGPADSYQLLDVLPPGTEVAVTGRTEGSFAEIVQSGKSRWVTADYLSDAKPTSEPAAAGGGVLSGVPCASGSSMESGITTNAVGLHRAVCAHFPQVTTYGGWRNDGEHSSGRAIDMMVYSDSSLGQQIADWVRANSSTLHISDVIWSQHIWTVQRSSEGWRSMPDRGSVTANHYDHVHVEVY